MKIEWTETARADLREIWHYIRRDSELYAQRMVDRIQLAVEKQAFQPESGHWLAEIQDKNIREIYVANYRIIYRVLSESMVILTVIHAAQDFRKESL